MWEELTTYGVWGDAAAIGGGQERHVFEIWHSGLRFAVIWSSPSFRKAQVVAKSVFGRGTG